MDCKNGKVSGEGSLFLLLLNEEGPEETKRLKGKERLLEAWKFRGQMPTPYRECSRGPAAALLGHKALEFCRSPILRQQVVYISTALLGHKTIMSITDSRSTGRVPLKEMGFVLYDSKQS